MIWTHLFQDHILDRGQDYYERDYVVRTDITDKSIKGVVYGTYEYIVHISIDNGEIIDMDCDCPHAFEGNNCKHMAAVLYSADYEDIDEDFETNDAVEPNMEISITELVEEADENIIRGFLVNAMEKDEQLLNRFRNTVFTEMSQADVRKYKSAINTIFRRYGGKHDFIDYNNAHYFYLELMEFIYEDLSIVVENGHYEEAFQLTNHIFIKLGNQDIDDSGGEISMLASACVEIWEDISDNCNKNMKNKMFHWYIDNLDDSVIDYMEERIESVLFDNFLEENYLAKKLELVEEKIQEYKQFEDEMFRNYSAEKWTMRYLEILEEQNISGNRIEEYCKENLGFTRVRRYYIDYCMRNKDYDLAIKLLKEGKSGDNKYHGIVLDYSLQLKEIYRNTYRLDDYKNELWSLVLEYKAGDLELYKELKSLYSTIEWQEKREIIFEKLTKYHNVDRLYEEEKLYDRLLNVVINTPGFYKLQEHEKSLKELYPKELLHKYEIEVKQMASHTSNRNRYREIVYILSRMQKYPGGEEKVDEIRNDWEVRYKNRRAMMDELGKL